MIKRLMMLTVLLELVLLQWARGLAAAACAVRWRLQPGGRRA